MTQPTAKVSKLADSSDNPQIGDQQAAITDVVATAATSTTPFGYAEAQANAIVTDLNLVLAALRAHGLIADS
jgi:hypothetical protein